MAHECRECGCACYCGGDIDDLVFNDTKYEINCTCCPDGAFEDDGEDWEDVAYYDEEPIPVEPLREEAQHED